MTHKGSECSHSDFTSWSYVIYNWSSAYTSVPGRLKFRLSVGSFLVTSSARGAEAWAVLGSGKVLVSTRSSAAINWEDKYKPRLC